MVLSTAATGVISEPLQVARVTLADCTEFRTWTNTSTRAAALEHIHIAGLPPTKSDEYTEDELDDFRPFAIIETHQAQGNRFQHASTTGPTRHYTHSGVILIYLEQAVTDLLLDDPAELDRQFQNTIGELLFDSDGGSGILDLSGTAGYLAINWLEVNGPHRATEQERVASGDSISAIFEIGWGNG